MESSGVEPSGASGKSAAPNPTARGRRPRCAARGSGRRRRSGGRGCRRGGDRHGAGEPCRRACGRPRPARPRGRGGDARRTRQPGRRACDDGGASTASSSTSSGSASSLATRPRSSSSGSRRPPRCARDHLPGHRVPRRHPPRDRQGRQADRRRYRADRPADLRPPAPSRADRLRGGVYPRGRVRARRRGPQSGVHRHLGAGGIRGLGRVSERGHRACAGGRRVRMARRRRRVPRGVLVIGGPDAGNEHRGHPRGRSRRSPAMTCGSQSAGCSASSSPSSRSDWASSGSSSPSDAAASRTRSATLRSTTPS